MIVRDRLGRAAAGRPAVPARDDAPDHDGHRPVREPLRHQRPGRRAGGPARACRCAGSQVDVIVLAMGSGAALGLGVVMGFVFKADERWSADDDRAIRQALDRELDPELARDSVSLWVHARSSVFVMLGIATPASRPPSSPSPCPGWLPCWLPLALVAAAFLFARHPGRPQRPAGLRRRLRPGHGRSGRGHRRRDAQGRHARRTTAAGATGATAAPRRCWSAAAPPSSSTARTGAGWRSAAAAPPRRTTSRR